MQNNSQALLSWPSDNRNHTNFGMLHTDKGGYWRGWHIKLANLIGQQLANILKP